MPGMDWLGACHNWFSGGGQKAMMNAETEPSPALIGRVQ
jgi:hypothetical protein